MRVILACGHERILSHGFPLKRKYHCPTCRTQQVVVQCIRESGRVDLIVDEKDAKAAYDSFEVVNPHAW